jgi:hypothetical protein
MASSLLRIGVTESLPKTLELLQLSSLRNGRSAYCSMGGTADSDDCRWFLRLSDKQCREATIFWIMAKRLQVSIHARPYFGYIKALILCKANWNKGMLKKAYLFEQSEINICARPSYSTSIVTVTRYRRITLIPVFYQFCYSNTVSPCHFTTCWTRCGSQEW